MTETSNLVGTSMVAVIICAIVVTGLRRQSVVSERAVGKRHYSKMFRNSLVRVNSVLRNAIVKPGVGAPGAVRLMSKHSTETDEQFDNRYEAYFNRNDIDGWEIRKGMNDLCGMDLVPEPKLIIAALKACRRVNDYSLAVRIIEAVKDKCGSKVNEIYPYLIQEIRPTLTELGINTPEELGYDKPELALENVYEMH